MIYQKKYHYFSNRNVTITVLTISSLLIIICMLRSGNLSFELMISTIILILYSAFLLIRNKKKEQIQDTDHNKTDNLKITNLIKEDKILDLLLANNKLLKKHFTGNKTNKYTLKNIFKTDKFNKTQVAIIKNEKKKILELVDEILENNFDDPSLDVQHLADRLYMSRAQLYRKFKTASKIPIAQYIRKYRLSIAKELLEKSNYNVSQVMYKTGFINLTSFSRSFKNEFHTSPSEAKINLDI